MSGSFLFFTLMALALPVSTRAQAPIATASADEPTSRTAFLTHLAATLGRSFPILDAPSAHPSAHPQSSNDAAPTGATWTITTLQVKSEPPRPGGLSDPVAPAGAAPAPVRTPHDTLFAGVTMTLSRRASVAAGDTVGIVNPGEGRPLASLLRLYRRDGGQAGGEDAWTLVAERLNAPEGFDPETPPATDAETMASTMAPAAAQPGGDAATITADIREMDFAIHEEPDGKLSLYVFWLENVAEDGPTPHYKMFGARVDNALTRAPGGGEPGRGGTAPFTFISSDTDYRVQLYSLKKGSEGRFDLLAMAHDRESLLLSCGLPNLFYNAPIIIFAIPDFGEVNAMRIKLYDLPGLIGEIEGIDRIVNLEDDYTSQIHKLKTISSSQFHDHQINHAFATAGVGMGQYVLALDGDDNEDDVWSDPITFSDLIVNGATIRPLGSPRTAGVQGNVIGSNTGILDVGAGDSVDITMNPYKGFLADNYDYRTSWIEARDTYICIRIGGGDPGPGWDIDGDGQVSSGGSRDSGDYVPLMAIKQVEP